MHIEQPINFEYPVARKLLISISPNSLNIERPEKFPYRAIGPPCCKTSFHGKQLPTKRWPMIATAQNQHWRYHPQVCFTGVTCPLPTSLRITLKEEGSAAVAEASKFKKGCHGLFLGLSRGAPSFCSFEDFKALSIIYRWQTWHEPSSVSEMQRD